MGLGGVPPIVGCVLGNDAGSAGDESVGAPIGALGAVTKVGGVTTAGSLKPTGIVDITVVIAVCIVELKLVAPPKTEINVMDDPD